MRFMRLGVCGPCGRYAVLCGQRWGVSRPGFKHNFLRVPSDQALVPVCAVMCGSERLRRGGKDFERGRPIRFSRAYSYRCDRIEKNKPVRGIEPPTPRLRSACSTIELHWHRSCGFQNSLPQTASDRLGDLGCFSSVIRPGLGLSLSRPLAECRVSLQSPLRSPLVLRGLHQPTFTSASRLRNSGSVTSPTSVVVLGAITFRLAGSAWVKPRVL